MANAITAATIKTASMDQLDDIMNSNAAISAMSNVTIQPVNPYHFYQGASFQYDGRRYSANVSKNGGESKLYVFGEPGDDCITTTKVENDDLLNEIVALVRRYNELQTGALK